ncbi:hypothetical protein C7972_102240 [Arenibacter sp. ARW7G5Y1]|nr:hypothetical protein C7972_102240 [Arenibacter sp. ARW7G5Y1]
MWLLQPKELHQRILRHAKLKIQLISFVSCLSAPKVILGAFKIQII